MKKNNILALLLVSAGVMLGSCSDDFLDKTPVNSYVAETYYTSDDAVMKAVEPLYNYAWHDYNQRAALGMGSIRANDGWNPYLIPEFATFQVTGLDDNLCNAWSSFYMVVTMANQLISDINKYSTGVSESTKNLALGEAYLMRGVAYFYLVRSWGDVMVYEDNQSVTDDPKIPLTKQEDVLKFCIRDFKQAGNLLPSTSTDMHATKYAAMAFEAKALLALSGWDKGGTRDESMLEEVKALCKKVIDSNTYSLLPDYADLFKYSTDNFSTTNKETVLALRWADPLTGTWGSMNSSFSDLAWSGSSDVTVWGGSYASIDMLDLYNENPADSARFFATYCLPGVYYSYWDTGNSLVKSSDKTTANGYPSQTGFLYTSKHCQLKKYVVGTKADCGGHLAQMASPLNTYLMRYSDVLLTYAEACLGNQSSVTGGEGLKAINEVRNRAGIESLKSYGLDELMHERRMEFAMENTNWYDFVTWYKWKKDYMTDFFNNKQHRAFQINSGDVIRNTDGTVSYRTFPNRQSTPWYFKDWDTQGWAEKLQAAGVKNVSYNQSDNKLYVNGTGYSCVCYWNDCLRGEDGTDVLLSGDEYKKLFNLDKMCKKQDGYDPVVINDANVFLPKPESDVLRNSYFNQPAQSYDFTWQADEHAE